MENKLKKKKILFITGEFIPYTRSVGGAIRVISFLKTLKNYNLSLISVKKNFYGYFGFKSYLRDVNKIYLNSEKFEKSKWYAYLLSFIKLFFGNFLYIVGIDNNYLNLAKYKIKLDYLLKYEKPEYIIISAPPFSLLKLVTKIRKADKNAKIILDYRDGWTFRVKSIYLKIFTFFTNKYEKYILNHCDYILCATVEIYNDISKIVDKKKTILLKNGFFKQNKKKIIKKQNKKINIGYFGLISDSPFGYRDINVLYDAVSSLNKLNFTFYGNSSIKKNYILNFKSFNFLNNISYFKTLEKMKKFDYLLILHTEKSTAKEVITGKFYEYLNSNTPMIMISNGETEAGKLIKKHNLGYVLDYSKHNLKDFFEKINIKKFKHKKIKALKNFSRVEQNKKLLNIIK